MKKRYAPCVVGRGRGEEYPLCVTSHLSYDREELESEHIRWDGRYYRVLAAGVL